MKGSGQNGTSKHYKRIVIVTRSGKKIFGDWYKVDEDSPLPFPAYSCHTEQDFKQLNDLLDKAKLKSIDYSNWYVEEKKGKQNECI